MDRKALRNFTHNAKSFLSLDSNTYKQWVFRYTFLELEKDLGTKGDLTTNIIFSNNDSVTGRVVSKSSGMIAGLAEIEYFLVDSDPNFRPSVEGRFEVIFKIKDGDFVKPGDVLCEITAGKRDLLMVERIVLNFLSRMSGVATFANRIVEKVKDFDVLIVPTRKTLWGLLDKKAVTVGGGGTHRLNLTDAVLVKDSHIDLMGRDFEKVFRRIADSNVECRFIEVEVDSADEALFAASEFVKLIDKSELHVMCALLLDNMKPADIVRTLDSAKKAGVYNQLLFEASGGINESNVVEYAKTGIDIISMGCLTGGVPGLDLGLEVSHF